MNLMRTTSVFVLGFCFVVAGQTTFAAGGGGQWSGPSRGGSGKSGAGLEKTYREGTQLLEEGECGEAERKFRKVLKAVPKSPEANLFRGMALQCQQKFDASTRYFKRARRHDKKLYVAYQLLGVAYLELGKSKAARNQLDDLARLLEACEGDCSERLMQAHSKLAAAISASDHDAADSTSSSPPEPDSEDRHGLLFAPVAEPQAAYVGAIELIHSERFAEAIETLRKLTTTIGPHPDVLTYLGYAHRRMGHFESAREYYEQALAIDPMHRGANEYLGEMWVELGQIDEARRRLERLDRACPFGCAEYEELQRVIGSRVVAVN